MNSIIFDLNGTLYQDTEIHYRAWGAFCERHGLPFSREIYYETMYGPANPVILRGIMPGVHTDAELDALSEERTDVKFAAVNIDENPELADEFDISSIPCVILFKNGAEADRSIGLVPKEALEDLLG